MIYTCTRLKNPSIILTPITEEEKAQVEQEFMGDEFIYVLYKLPNNEKIQIGMMSSSMRKYFSISANVGHLDEATSMAFFYNGASSLKSKALEVTDRPVYEVEPDDDRTVSSYKVLNRTPEHDFNVSLNDVIDGKYTFQAEEPSVLKKLK